MLLQPKGGAGFRRVVVVVVALVLPASLVMVSSRAAYWALFAINRTPEFSLGSGFAMRDLAHAEASSLARPLLPLGAFLTLWESMV